MTLCEGGTLDDVRTKLRRDFWPTFSAELAVWPVVQVRAMRGAFCYEALQYSRCSTAKTLLCAPMRPLLALWCLVLQAVNFKLVPVQFQLMVVNVFTILGEVFEGCRAGCSELPTSFVAAIHYLHLHCMSLADSCFMSWARANDGWFPRLFPGLAAQLGVQPHLAAASSGAASSKAS